MTVGNTAEKKKMAAERILKNGNVGMENEKAEASDRQCVYTYDVAMGGNGVDERNGGSQPKEWSALGVPTSGLARTAGVV